MTSAAEDQLGLVCATLSEFSRHLAGLVGAGEKLRYFSDDPTRLSAAKVFLRMAEDALEAINDDLDERVADDETAQRSLIIVRQALVSARGQLEPDPFSTFIPDGPMAASHAKNILDSTPGNEGALVLLRQKLCTSN